MSDRRSPRRPNPYVGPRPFRTGEPLFGRNREVAKLRDLLIAERIVVLYSPSGAGKTSLIQAGLIPELEKKDFLVLPVIRVNQPPLADGGRGAPANRYVLSALRSLDSGLPEEDQQDPAVLPTLELATYLSRRPRPAGGPATEVLIFDQFEEILTLDPTDRDLKAAFFAQVGAALRAEERWALFSLREDHLAALDPFLPEIPTRLRARFRLDLLGTQAAALAVREPAIRGGVPFTDDAAGKLVDDLSRTRVQRAEGEAEERPGPYVEPVQLQVVCYRLWEGLADDATRITVEDLAEAGDVDAALGSYYAERVSAVAEASGGMIAERAIRDWFDRHLITEQGVRGQVLLGSERRHGLDGHVVKSLVDAHLVRTEERRGATWLELTHDRLIAPLRKNNEEWRQANLSDLQRQARVWESEGRPPRLLLLGGDLAEAERWADAHPEEVTTVEREFLEQCRAAEAEVQRAGQARARRVRIAVAAASVAAALVASVLAGWASLERNRAEAERVRAEKQVRTARSLLMGVQANSFVDDQLDLALLLNLEAVRVEDSIGTRSNVLATVLQNPHLTRFLRHHSDDVTAVAYSRDGTTLASASKDGTIRLLDPKTGQPKSEPLAGDHGTVHTVAFGVDDRTLASGNDDGSVVLWDVATHQPLRTLAAHAGRVSAVAFSPKGTILATAGCGQLLERRICDRGEVRLWDLAADGQGRMLASDLVVVNAVAFSPDGLTLVAGGCSRRDVEEACDLGVVRRWNIDTGERIDGLLQDHVDGVLSVAFSPDGATLASAACGRRGLAGTCELGEIHLWDPKTGQPKGEPLAGHTGMIHAVAFGPDGTLASAGSDGRVILWDTRILEQRRTLEGHRDRVTGVAFSPDGASLASSSQDGTVILWDTKDPPRRTLAGHTGIVAAVAFADASTMISGGEDGAVTVWDLATDRPRTTLWDILVVSAVGSSPDGTILAAGGCIHVPTPDICGAGGLRFWHLRDSRPIGELLQGHAFGVTGLDFDPAGGVLATGGCGARAKGRCSLGEVRLWDPATARPLGDRLPGDLVAVNAVAFSPDGTTVAAGGCSRRNAAGTCEGGVVLRWEAATRDPIGEPLVGQHAQTVRTIAFSPNGQILASGGVDGKVVLWATETGEPLRPLLEHGNRAVRSLAFSPDGQILAVGTEGEGVVLWDVASAQRLGQLPNDPSLGRSLAFSPDGRILATSTYDGRIVLWDGEFDAWQARACDRANRNLTPSEWERYVGAKPEHLTCPNIAPGDEPAPRPPATPVPPAPTPIP